MPRRLPAWETPAARSADQSCRAPTQVFSGDILEIWFDSIVARRLSAQHTLTTAMLNTESPSPLLAGLPFSRETETGRYEVEQLDLLDKRLDVLKGELVWSSSCERGRLRVFR